MRSVSVSELDWSAEAVKQRSLFQEVGKWRSVS